MSLFFFWLAHVVLALAVSAAAFVVFAPPLRRLFHKCFPADVARDLVRFAALALFAAGLSTGFSLSGQEVSQLRIDMLEWDIFSLKLYVALIQILEKVAQALAYLYAAAVAAYLVTRRRGRGDDAAPGAQDEDVGGVRPTPSQEAPHGT